MQRMWALLREAFWIIVAIAIVAGGYLGFQALGAARPVVEAAPVEREVDLVEVQRLAPHTGGVPIKGEGFVRPHRSLTVATESPGRIVTLHPAIIERGTFDQGDVLVALDDRNARAAIAQIDANIRSSQARLTLTRTQLDRAERLRADGIIAQDQLDQLLSQSAELAASIEALEASRLSAQIALDNTVVRAPFAGTVLTQQADRGAVVGAGQAIADVYSHEALEVLVPLREADAALIPGLFEGAAPAATISSTFAGVEYVWGARVDRVENRLDAQTRTLSVAVRIDDPQGAHRADGGPLPPAGAVPGLINAFARIAIKGATYDDLYALPSTSVRDGASVWLEDAATLRVHPVQPVHVDGETTYVRITDLPQPANLITTTLAAVTPGQPVRSIGTTRTAAAEPAP